MRLPILLPLALAVAGCGGAPATTTVMTTAGTGAGTALVDPAALYCSGTGGTVIQRVAGGRRADLCRLPDGRIVSAGDLLNSHNDL